MTEQFREMSMSKEEYCLLVLSLIKTYNDRCYQRKGVLYCKDYDGNIEQKLTLIYPLKEIKQYAV